MNFGEYCKDKWPILMVNAAAMLAAGLFLIAGGKNTNDTNA